MRRIYRYVLMAGILAVTVSTAKAGTFDYKSVLFGTPSTLSVSLTNVDTTSGVVNANGGDSQCPTTPFTWDWGDGNVTSGFFPQQHTYSDLAQNYIIALTSHYTGGGTDTSWTQARFTAPQINPVSLPSNVSATIPNTSVTLTSRMPGYTPPATLTHFSDADFGIVPRSTIEYVLTAAASVQMDFVNGNVPLDGGTFGQVVLKDTNLAGGGMYSLWYTDPVSFGAGASSVTGSIQYSSFMHEMGHNFTLNSPADYYYGGKIDGNANAIYSETIAQIYQHATAYQLINNAAAYGLSDDLAADLELSATSSMKIVRNAYDDYVDGGCSFASWNDPSTPGDETFGTFMTLAYKFFEHAENDGLGYETPSQRMTELLGLFDESLKTQWDRLHDTLDADAFRSTLMVTAMSYAFSEDLRQEFRDLNFPINDLTYQELMNAVPEPGTLVLLITAGLGALGYAWRRRRS